MNIFHDRIRKAVSIGIASLLLVTGVVVPILERLDLSGEVVVESPHEPGACHNAHDHTICTQVSANASLSSRPELRVLVVQEIGLTTPTDGPEIASAAFPEGHPSRAPPLA